MPRRRGVQNRQPLPDTKFDSRDVAKFITRMMLNGKKSISANILYSALALASERSKEKEMALFSKALENVRPTLEVKSRRVGGSTYQVPIEIREGRRDLLAMRWIIVAARKRTGKSMSERLCSELLDAFNNTGTAVKQKQDAYRMAEANKAFAYYRW